MTVALGQIASALLGPRPANGEQKMETLPVKPENKAPVPTGTNPFVAFAVAEGADGVPCRFDGKSGVWKSGLGDDAATIPSGTQLVAQMEFLAFVWNKWVNNKRVDRKVAIVGNWEVPLRRDQLDDHDTSRWELDDESQPRDPWQQSLELGLLDIETGEMLVFATNSVGGKTAIRKLSAAYGRGQKKFPRHNPIVELGASGYQHRIKTRGYIHVPTLAIVGWEPRDDADEPPQKTAADALNDAIPF
jgi:hypothetical protein